MPTAINFSTLRRLWIGLSVLQILLLAHLAFYLLGTNTGRGLSFFALAGAVTLTAIGVFTLTIWLTAERIAQIREWVNGGRWLLVIGGGALLVILGYGMRPEWFYVQMALTEAATLSLLFVTFYEDRPRLSAAIWALLVVATASIILLRIYALAYYPGVNLADEPWVLSWGHSYVKTGHVTDRVMLGFDGGEAVSNWIPFYYTILGMWLTLVGTGLWEARLFAFLLTFPVILFGSLAARNLYGKQAGWATAVALFSSAQLLRGVEIRHDIGLALAEALSLYLYSEAVKRNRLLYHFLAGVVMGLGMFSHFDAAYIGPVMLIALYLPRYIQQCKQGRYWPEAGLWFYSVGGLLSAALFVGVHILPNPEAFYFRPRRIESIAEFIPSLVAHLRNIVKHSRIEFVLILLGLASALWRRKGADLTMVLLFVLGQVVFAVFIRQIQAYNYHVVHLSPIYGLLIGGSLFSFVYERLKLADHDRITQNVVLVTLVVMIPVLTVTLRVPLEQVLKGAPMKPAPPFAAQWIMENVSPDKRILGNLAYYFWLYDYAYASPGIPARVSRLSRSEEAQNNPAGFWDEVAIDIFISDQSFDVVEFLPPGYLESRGYEILVEKGPVTIYGKPGVLASGAAENAPAY